jgi:predicted alpha/beta hydrolase family esterase
VASKVRGLFLVAPADPHKFAVTEQLPSGPLALPGRMVASRTDPWLSWASALQWAQRWQLPLIDAGDAGHINAESGHGFWREGWRAFQQLRGFDRQRQAAREPRWALAI